MDTLSVSVNCVMAYSKFNVESRVGVRDRLRDCKTVNIHKKHVNDRFYLYCGMLMVDFLPVYSQFKDVCLSINA